MHIRINEHYFLEARQVIYINQKLFKKEFNLLVAFSNSPVAIIVLFLFIFENN